ncbi:C4-type zinc ribbon domain-containing protein [Nakamurella sp. A5-74]|uniref:C4-type zinc ribbon domain-containing protein n=1 Tax=Nakamurella sp. A5-74 TaxID=3158264 RepID=A0AAU8DJX4_9ACTN
MPKADPFEQHRLIDLAETDRAINGAKHRRQTLPELAVLAAAAPRLMELRTARILADTDVSDLQRDSRKLDGEIDQVRARSERDNQRLAAGTMPMKDLTNLQHELESLARRQGVLEDQSLELMERAESAEQTQAAAVAAHEALQQEVAAAETRRDDAFADLDDEISRLEAVRAEQVSHFSADLLALYEKIRATGRIAAARLNGAQCQACRLSLDAVAIGRIRAAAVDDVVRCDECGAILIRS